MYPAIPKFFIVQTGLFGPLPGQLFDTRYGFSLLFRFLDLFQQDMCRFSMFVQVIIQFGREKIHDKVPH